MYAQHRAKRNSSPGETRTLRPFELSSIVPTYATSLLFHCGIDDGEQHALPPLAGRDCRRGHDPPDERIWSTRAALRRRILNEALVQQSGVSATPETGQLRDVARHSPALRLMLFALSRELSCKLSRRCLQRRSYGRRTPVALAATARRIAHPAVAIKDRSDRPVSVPHSTVTDLARFLGWSTSVPFSKATR